MQLLATAEGRVEFAAGEFRGYVNKIIDVITPVA
jgi:hypothetical protein